MFNYYMCSQAFFIHMVFIHILKGTTPQNMKKSVLGMI